jgi:hypothetical protein
MSDETGVLFSAEAAERIAAATKWQEHWPRSRKPTRGTPAAPGAEVFLSRVTSSSADGSGFYPGVITQRQPDGSFVDFGNISIGSLNGSPLTSGRYYYVKGVDPNYAVDPAYLVLGGSSTIDLGSSDPGTGDTTQDFPFATSISVDLASGLNLNGSGVILAQAASANHAGNISLVPQTLGAGTKSFADNVNIAGVLELDVHGGSSFVGSLQVYTVDSGGRSQQTFEGRTTVPGTAYFTSFTIDPGNARVSILATSGGISIGPKYSCNGNDGVTTSFTYVKTVNFGAQTVTTGTVTITGGIITNVT